MRCTWWDMYSASSPRKRRRPKRIEFKDNNDMSRKQWLFNLVHVYKSERWNYSEYTVDIWKGFHLLPSTGLPSCACSSQIWCIGKSNQVWKKKSICLKYFIIKIQNRYWICVSLVFTYNRYSGSEQLSYRDKLSIIWTSCSICYLLSHSTS